MLLKYSAINGIHKLMMALCSEYTSTCSPVKLTRGLYTPILSQTFVVSTSLPLFRTTASAVGLVSVRIGAILGITLFGLFVDTSPAVPIIMVAVLLSVGAVLALFLPKTTKGTRLE